MCGEQLGDVDIQSQAIRELNQLATDVCTQNVGNALLDTAPGLRHLPGFPPYKRVLQYNEKRDEMYENIICPALVRES